MDEVDEVAELQPGLPDDRRSTAVSWEPHDPGEAALASALGHFDTHEDIASACGFPAGESSRGMNLHTVVYFVSPPNSNHIDPWKANSFHPGGVMTCFADGSVHFIPDTIELDVWKGLATIAGGEVPDSTAW